MLFVRADASTTIGTGHVMRMLALAQAWRRRGGEAIFVCSECPTELQERLKREGFAVHVLNASPGSEEDLRAFLEILLEADKPRVALDNYHFNCDYQTAVRQVASRLLLVDDYAHLDQYNCDILLNQNLGANSLGLKEKAGGAQLLLGSKFILLREEFLNLEKIKPTSQSERLRLLITMGGSDAHNVTSALLAHLKHLVTQPLEVRVLLGSANLHTHEVQSLSATMPFPTEVIINTADMPSYLLWADAAITAGGSTCWEMAYMGVPMAVVVVAENQAKIAEHLDREGMAINLGWHSNLANYKVRDRLQFFLNNKEARTQLEEKAKQVVDGKGSARICAALLTSKFRLRRATIEDSWAIWNLANDPTVRASSFLSDSIPWDSHCVWLENKLKDPAYHILLAIEEPSEMLGVIRFECVNSDTARISIAVATQRRGCGIGTSLITEGVNWIFRETQVATIEAYIRPENAASISAFEKAGFQYEMETLAHGQQALKYLFQKETKPA